MAISSITQYSITCDCGEGDVLNQGDFGKIWTLKNAMALWRRHNWRIGRYRQSCPDCSPNLNNTTEKDGS